MWVINRPPNHQHHVRTYAHTMQQQKMIVECTIKTLKDLSRQNSSSASMYIARRNRIRGKTKPLWGCKHGGLVQIKLSLSLSLSLSRSLSLSLSLFLCLSFWKEKERQRRKEEKKERRKEGKKERRKQGNKERRKEGKKERRDRKSVV